MAASVSRRGSVRRLPRAYSRTSDDDVVTPHAVIWRARATEVTPRTCIRTDSTLPSGGKRPGTGGAANMGNSVRAEVTIVTVRHDRDSESQGAVRLWSAFGQLREIWLFLRAASCHKGDTPDRGGS